MENSQLGRNYKSVISRSEQVYGIAHRQDSNPLQSWLPDHAASTPYILDPVNLNEPGQWLCGSVGRAVTSNTIGPWFESSHRQKNYCTFVYCQLCIEKTKINKKRPGMAHLKKILMNTLTSLKTHQWQVPDLKRIVGKSGSQSGWNRFRNALHRLYLHWMWSAGRLFLHPGWNWSPWNWQSGSSLRSLVKVLRSQLCQSVHCDLSCFKCQNIQLSFDTLTAKKLLK